MNDNSIVTVKKYKQTKDLFGISPNLFKGLPIEKVHELKIAICDLHLKYQLELPLDKRDNWYIKELIDAKKWNKEALNELECALN